MTEGLSAADRLAYENGHWHDNDPPGSPTLGTSWQSAHDLLRTDWAEVDPRNRPRPTSEQRAFIRCGLIAKNGRGQCRDRFFTEEGRDLHHEEEHDIRSVAERV